MHAKNTITLDTWKWVGALSLGLHGLNQDKLKLSIYNLIFKKPYANTTPTKTLGIGELFLGGQLLIHPHLSAQMGIAVAGTTPMTLTGQIWEDADPNFNNFNYSYQVQHSHVAAKAKLIADMPYVVQPYLSGSLGAGYNRAQNFTITRKLIEEIPAPPFRSQTTTAFTYTAGIGLQKSVSKHCQVGIGYEFASWGNTNLDPALGQQINGGISLNHIYTHQLQFSLSLLS